MGGEPAMPGVGSSARAGRPPYPWIRIGLGIAAASYGAGAAYGLVALGSVLWVRVTETVAALILGAAFALSFRRPALAATLGIATVWAELVLSVGLVGTVAPAMYALPVLVVGTGLLLGGRAAIAIAAVSAAAVPAATWLGGNWGALSGGAAEGHRVLVAAATLLGTAVMVQVALSAHGAALAESERTRLRYQGLFASTPEAVVVTDAAGRLVEANPAAERLLGRAQGARLAEILSGPERGPPPPPRPGAPSVAELVSPAGGRRTVEVTSTDLRGSGPEAGRVLHVLRDVTEARALEERLRHAQRLESVGLLAGGVAHDFNNLLTAVGGNAALLAEHPDASVRELATEIQDAQRRGATLTRQLLAFARRDLARPGSVDLAVAVRDMRQLLARLVGEQHRIVIEEEGPVPVVADRGHVEQVVLNLVANARDAMPEGGDVRVRSRTVAAPEARAAGSTLSAQRQALLEVADSGVGMPPETAARVFEPFFTTKSRGQGTGLGLSTVHGIVGQSGGCVTVDTAPGRGAAFRVFLPLADAPAAEVPPGGPPPRAAVPGGRERLLVVEDDDQVRAFARRVLEGAGYEVAVAPSGDVALSSLARDGAALVLADVALPGTSGLEIARRAAAERPGLPVLLMSGYVEPSLAGARGLDPARDLLRKPFTAEELLRRVRAALDARAAGG